jgi:glucose-6-phosphate isomerase
LHYLKARVRRAQTFIEVLKDRDAKTSLEVEPGITAGDYLQGFYLGTRDALSEKDRHSVTLTLPDVSPRTLGMLIALYERVVGLYATLIGINAYHQPGVEAGKKAAGGVIVLKQKITAALQATTGKFQTVEEIAAQLGDETSPEPVFKILEHLAANRSSGVKKRAREPWYQSRYGM